VAQFANPNIVTFAQLKQSEIQLNGPYEQRGFSFAPPADWGLTAGAQLDLSFGVSFNTTNAQANAQEQSDIVAVSGGTLTVMMNNVVLAVISLTKIGEVSQKIDIPVAAFVTDRTDGRMDLRFILDSGFSCRTSGLHTIVFIRPTSFLTLPHTAVKPSTSLVNFPRPIFQNSFVPDTALLIVPNDPSPAELQAALTTAAGLANLSGNTILLDMVTQSGFNSTNAGNNHLIFVGKSGSLPILSGLTLPLPISNGQFALSEDGQDDGVVEMINSPWSSTGSHVILVVSANTDLGIVKAAQAVSTGVLRPNRFENLSVIREVNTTPITSPQAVDRTLTDLGFGGSSLQTRGYSSEEYTFDVPTGTAVSPDAYFELIYGHSSLIDYNSSQIVIILNDQPIGSIRMSDATASLPTNRAKFMIPPAAVVPGKNYLNVVVNLEPVQDCTSPDTQGLWVNIWPQSTLHLPLTATSFTLDGPQDLAAYPAPFIYNPVLEDTAFVFARKDLESWRKALQIAAYLGSHAKGPLAAFSVYYGDDMPVAERAKYHLIVVGRPSQIPLVGEMNDNLPVPFLAGSDIVSDSASFQVTYQIPPDAPIGYIQTMLSPWNPNHVVLAILGNTAEGVGWAASALIEATLRYRLGGNFAVVNDRQIITINTRFAAAATTGNINATPVSNVPISLLNTASPPPTARPGWILPLLALLVGLILVILTAITFRNRTRRQPKMVSNSDQQAQGSQKPKNNPPAR